MQLPILPGIEYIYIVIGINIIVTLSVYICNKAKATK